VVAVFAVLHAIPPSSITIETGPIGGSYYDIALAYRQALREHGIDAILKPNPDSLDIIGDVDRSQADIGFTAQPVRSEQYQHTVSAGAIELQPLFIFYNVGLGQVAALTSLRGKRIVMPPERSATSEAALRILRLFDITPQNTRISFLPLVDAAKALKADEFDAGAFMLEPENALITGLVNDDNLRLLSLDDGLAITRRMPFLRTTIVPRGSYDTETDVPPADIQLLAATVNIVVRKDIHPAVLYTLLDAMTEVHHGTTLVNGPGEFPSFVRTDLPLHPLAVQYAKSGEPWLYHNLPLPLASLIDRYLIIGIVIVLATEIYKSAKYLGELVTFILENVCLRVLHHIDRTTRHGHALGGGRLAVVRIAERLLLRSSKRTRGQELIGRIRRHADPNP
jgi:TRAP-type uncharacterized transport system substrate-binding protein